jgi:Zn finger protein HypA/HybF involved in hydrogenase expression
MALTAFCTTCQRTVYIEEEETPVCPVCSSPLVETSPAVEGDEAAPDQAGGAK